MNLNTRITLLEKIKVSDSDEAWNEFHDYYFNYLRLVITRFNISTSDADDIIQKVMLVCWDKVKDFDHQGVGHFRSWLIKTTKNSAMNFIRSSQKHINKKKKYSNSQEENINSKFDKTAEKEWRVYLSKLAWERIRGNYQENAQKSFDLLMTGLNNKEVAEKLDIKANTVAVFKKRILESLKDQILQLDEFLN